MVNSKSAFWQAFLSAVLIFGIGLVLGFFLEGVRENKVDKNFLNSEINFADEQVRSKIVENSEVVCDLAKNSTFSFADKIYYEALKLEDYDSASKFGDILLLMHKRYDLLRVILWQEGIKLKQNCGQEFHTVVYLYNYNEKDIDIKAKQVFFSRLLFEVKQKNPDKILLIPIAVNTDLSSTELMLAKYNITEIPSILINEEKKVNEVITTRDFEKMLID